MIITANDGHGGVATTSFQLTIQNVSPTVTISGPTAGTEGTPIAFTAAATDPSASDTAAGLSITWGVSKNGAPYAAGVGSNISFTPDDDGVYVVGQRRRQGASRGHLICHAHRR